MSDQLVFIDTEFTNFSDPQLISIGLAASTGEEFYAEVSFSYANCTDFVRSVVIPLLNDINPCSCDELHVRLRDWFTVIKCRSKIIICYDSQYDRNLFLSIFDNNPPPFLEFRDIGSGNVIELLRYEFHIKNSLAEHHALNDALANRYAFRENQV